ncbi:MAG: hypothetical protein LBI69_00155 [Puniceicoccales bacterium]|jgi:hypothetical protein|nr:hypothetical protein [Puniceicoccales bacterium]
MFIDYLLKRKSDPPTSDPVNAADSPVQSPMPTAIQWTLMVVEALIEGMALSAVLLAVLACSIPALSTSLLCGISAIAAVLSATAILIAVGFCRKNRQIDGLKNAAEQANAGKESESTAEHFQVEYDKIVKENETLQTQIDELKNQKSETAHILTDEAAQTQDKQLAKSQLQVGEPEGKFKIADANEEALQTDLEHVTKVANGLLQRQIALQKNIQGQVEQFQKSSAINENVSFSIKVLQQGKKLIKSEISLDEKINFLNDLKAKLNGPKSSEMDTESKLVRQFFDPDYDMFAFIGQLAPESLGKILDALTSPNYATAMAILEYSKEMRVQINVDLFERLAQGAPVNYLFSSPNVENILQRYFDNEKGKVGIQQIAAMENLEIGSEFFSDDKNFTENLDKVSALLGKFALFLDFRRSLEIFEVIINGKKCDDWASWAKNIKSKGEVGYGIESFGLAQGFLQKLKNSGLPPEDALKALKSIWYLNWTQGGTAAMLLAIRDTIGEDALSALDMPGFSDNMTFTPCCKVKIEILKNGDVKMSLIDTSVIKTRPSDKPKDNYYFFGHMTVECNSEGNNRVVDAMAVMDMF